MGNSASASYSPYSGSFDTTTQDDNRDTFGSAGNNDGVGGIKKISGGDGGDADTGGGGVYLSAAVLESLNSSMDVSTVASPFLDDSSRGDGEEARKDRISRHSFASSYNKVLANNSAGLTTFLLLNTMIGSGILNQPYVFRQSGLVGGLVGFLVASVATWYGLLILTDAGIHMNILEYSGLAKRAFAQNGERLIDVSIIVSAFGSMLGYILVVGTTLSGLLISWGCTYMLCDVFFTTIITVSLFVTPICLFRHFGHLAFLSLFSVLAIVAVLMLVIIGGPLKYQPNSGSITIFNVRGTLTSIGSIIFSLSCASANFQAFISTEKPARNMGSWRVVTGTAVSIGSIMCAAMGVAGYLSFRDTTNGEILDNFPQVGFDFFKVMVVTHLILYIPVNFVIMRYSIVKLFAGVRSETLPFWKHTLLTIVLIAGTTAFVLMMLGLGLASGDAFALILNITGGIGGSLATFILPSAIYLKLMPVTGGLRTLAICLLLFGCTVMITSVTVTIADFSSR